MQVLFVASECAPFVKTGGLADVVGALPKALAAEGIEVRVLLPAYPALAGAVAAAKTSVDLGNMYSGPARIVATRAEGLDLLLLDAPHLFDRPGNPYLGPDGVDWPDNHLRFAALSRAAAMIATGHLKTWTPELIHLHDWQAGPVAAYLDAADDPAPPTVMTIHNIAFQGLFPAKTAEEIGFPAAGFHPEGYEYYGKVGYLKAGLVHADRITTVSPTYARELMTPEFGMGLQGVLADRRSALSGILNGIDLETWNPETDESIAAPYGVRRPGGKARNRAALEKRFGIAARPGAPLFCVVSRLTEQKGLDLLLEALPRLLMRGARLAVLGSGDKALEKAYSEAAIIHAGSVGTIIGYDEPLSHLMQAGADAIVIPSRFEPCGLTQLYGLRYGTLPVVARTGGLADTIIDANDAALIAGCANGFQFAPVTAAALIDAIERACDLFAEPKIWKAMMRRAMRHPVGWDRSASAYASLYAGLMDDA